MCNVSINAARTRTPASFVDMKVHALLLEFLAGVPCTDKTVEQYVLERDEDIEVDDELKPKIFRHFEQVFSHRLWVSRAYALVRTVDASLATEMEERVAAHDLSKFSSAEIVGYALKWGRSDSDGPIEPEEESQWEASLKHHYSHNDHHPEFFGKGNAMSCASAFKESIVDRVGCRLQRNLLPLGWENVSVEDIFAIPPRFLGNYTEEDKQKVLQTLQTWCEKLENHDDFVQVMNFD